MKKHLSILVLCLALSGCATAKMNENLNSWIGQAESLLIETYGAPESIYKISSTESVLTYTESGFTSLPISTYNTVTRATTIGGSSIGASHSCRVNFTIKSHKVTKYSRQGRGCGFVKAVPKNDDQQ